MLTRVSRQVYNDQTIDGQADFLSGDSYTRITGLTVSQLTCVTFFNNVLQPWLFVSGSGVTDGQIAGGVIYWVEIPGSPGFYSVRFRPNALGYWRVLIGYPPGTQLVSLEYDVIALPPVISQGLTASTIRPC